MQVPELLVQAFTIVWVARTKTIKSIKTNLYSSILKKHVNSSPALSPSTRAVAHSVIAGSDPIVFALTPRHVALPQHYSGFAELLVEAIVEEHGTAGLRTRLARIAAAVVNELEQHRRRRTARVHGARWARVPVPLQPATLTRRARARFSGRCLVRGG